MRTDVIHTVLLPPVSREGDQSYKMSSQEMMLTWNGHHETLISLFEKLLENNTLVDCTIAVGSRKLKAHKEVLCAFSPYFELLLEEENEESPTIILSGFSFQNVQCIINFMYHGKVTINEDKVEELIDDAQCLRIKGLGGGHKEYVSGNRKGQHREREAYSSHVPSKRKRPVSDEDSDSVSYPEFDANVENQSYRSPGKIHSPVESFTSHQSKRSSPSQSQTSTSTSDESFENNDTNSDPNYSSFPVQPTLSSPNAEDHILDPALIVKTELGPDHRTNLVKNNSSVVSKVKQEDSLEIASCQNSRSSCSRTSDEAILGLPSDLGSQNEASYDSPLPPNFVNVKTEPSTEDDMLVSEDESYIGARTGTTSTAPPSTTIQRTYGPIPTRAPTSVDWPHNSSSSLSHSAPMEVTGPGRRPQARRAPREYTCPECHKVFRQSCNLKVHLRIHTGERPYKCSECDFAATHISNLKQHQRIHSGERPFKCSECNFAAAGSGDLKKHQRIHSGEKPYRCTECDFAATGSGDLHKHLKIHGKDVKDRPSSVPGTSDLIHSIPKYFENNYLLKMSNL